MNIILLRDIRADGRLPALRIVTAALCGSEKLGMLMGIAAAG